MSLGNTATNAPPKPTSHTSCQDQRGPIAATTCRRSCGVLATNQWSIPAPKLRPSSVTYVMSIKLTTPNHSAIIVTSPSYLRQLPHCRSQSHFHLPRLRVLPDGVHSCVQSQRQLPCPDRGRSLGRPERGKADRAQNKDR